MGRMTRLRNLEPGTLDDIPADVADIERLDYIHAMLGSLLKVMAKPGANTLRSLVWLSKAEARRVLEETKEAVAAMPRAKSEAAAE